MPIRLRLRQNMAMSKNFESERSPVDREGEQQSEREEHGERIEAGLPGFGAIAA